MKLILKTISGIIAIIFTMNTVVWADPAFVYKLRVPEEYGKVVARYKADSRINADEQHGLARMYNNSPLAKGVPEKAGDVNDNGNINEIIYNPLAPFHKGDSDHPRSSVAQDAQRDVQGAWCQVDGMEQPSTQHVAPSIGKTIVLLQDAHASLDAQLNIAQIIRSVSKYLQDKNLADLTFYATKEKDVSMFINPLSFSLHPLQQNSSPVLLAVEGAVGPLKTDVYREFPIAEARNAVGRDYVRDGMLSGAEYGALIADKEIELYGVEDEHLFTANFKDYYEASQDRADSLAVIHELEVQLEKEKEKHYSKELLAFERAARGEEITYELLSEYIPLLITQSEKQGIDLYAYPILSQCMEFMKTGKERDIDAVQLNEEIQQLRAENLLLLAKSEREKKLLRYGWYLTLLRHQAQFEVTESEIAFSETYCGRMMPEDVVNYLVPDNATYTRMISALKRITHHAQVFYRKADQRSRALLDNTLHRMDEKGVTEAVLVVGGYHTRLIEEECKKRGINYLTISPTIADLTKTVPYLDRMTGALYSLRPHLASTITGLSLYLMEDQHKIALWKDLTEGEIAETIRMIVETDTHDQDTMQMLTEKLISFCKDEKHYIVDEQTVVRTIEVVRAMQKRWQKDMHTFSKRVSQGEILKTLTDNIAERKDEQARDLYASIKQQLDSFYQKVSGSKVEKALQINISHVDWETPRVKQLMADLSKEALWYKTVFEESGWNRTMQDILTQSRDIADRKEVVSEQEYCKEYYAYLERMQHFLEQCEKIYTAELRGKWHTDMFSRRFSTFVDGGFALPETGLNREELDFELYDMPKKYISHLFLYRDKVNALLKQVPREEFDSNDIRIFDTEWQESLADVSRTKEWHDELINHLIFPETIVDQSAIKPHPLGWSDRLTYTYYLFPYWEYLKQKNTAHKSVDWGSPRVKQLMADLSKEALWYKTVFEESGWNKAIRDMRTEIELIASRKKELPEAEYCIEYYQFIKRMYQLLGKCYKVWEDTLNPAWQKDHFNAAFPTFVEAGFALPENEEVKRWQLNHELYDMPKKYIVPIISNYNRLSDFYANVSEEHFDRYVLPDFEKMLGPDFINKLQRTKEWHDDLIAHLVSPEKIVAQLAIKPHPFDWPYQLIYTYYLFPYWEYLKKNALQHQETVVTKAEILQLTETVNAAVKNTLDSTSSEELAYNYTQGPKGQLMSHTLPEKNGASIARRLKQAHDHLDKANPNAHKRAMVEEALTLLANHLDVEKLYISQFEGIAHRLVKQFSGVEDPYKQYKDDLDTAAKAIIESFRLKRDELNSTSPKEALKYACMVATTLNLLDLTSPKSFKKVAQALGCDEDFVSGLITPEKLKIVVQGIVEKAQQGAIVVDMFDVFYENISAYPGGKVLYYLDNHGEAVLDELAIEQLLRMGYQVAVVARGELVRDDITQDEAYALFHAQGNPLNKYLQDGRLTVITDGSFTLGADMYSAKDQPEFMEAWKESIGFIAKGAGNMQTLFQQDLTRPGLFMRMIKESKNAYGILEEVFGKEIEQKTFFDMALAYQKDTVKTIDWDSPQMRKGLRDLSRVAIEMKSLLDESGWNHAFDQLLSLDTERLREEGKVEKMIERIEACLKTYYEGISKSVISTDLQKPLTVSFGELGLLSSDQFMASQQISYEVLDLVRKMVSDVAAYKYALQWALRDNATEDDIKKIYTTFDAHIRKSKYEYDALLDCLIDPSKPRDIVDRTGYRIQTLPEVLYTALLYPYWEYLRTKSAQTRTAHTPLPNGLLPAFGAQIVASFWSAWLGLGVFCVTVGWLVWLWRQQYAEQGNVTTLRLWSPWQRAKIVKEIEKANGEIACFVHLNSTADIALVHTRSMDPYITYLKNCREFMEKATIPIFAMVEAREIEAFKKWLTTFPLQTRVVIVPTFYRNPEPFWGFNGVMSVWMGHEASWDQAFVGLGIKKVLLAGEEAEGCRLNQDGTFFDGGSRCIGSAYTYLSKNFEVRGQEKLLYPDVPAAGIVNNGRAPFTCSINWGKDLDSKEKMTDPPDDYEANICNLTRAVLEYVYPLEMETVEWHGQEQKGDGLISGVAREVLKNAMHAFDAETNTWGNLTVTVSPVISNGVKSVQVVAKNDMGIIPDIPKAVKPYFSQRQFGQGQGLGLPIIIENVVGFLQGTVLIESNGKAYSFYRKKQTIGRRRETTTINRGTHITLRIPLGEDASSAREKGALNEGSRYQFIQGKDGNPVVPSMLLNWTDVTSMKNNTFIVLAKKAMQLSKEVMRYYTHAEQNEELAFWNGDIRPRSEFVWFILMEMLKNAMHAYDIKKKEWTDLQVAITEIERQGHEYVVVQAHNIDGEIDDLLEAIQPGFSKRVDGSESGFGLITMIDIVVRTLGGEVWLESKGKRLVINSEIKKVESTPDVIKKGNGTRLTFWLPKQDRSEMKGDKAASWLSNETYKYKWAAWVETIIPALVQLCSLYTGHSVLTGALLAGAVFWGGHMLRVLESALDKDEWEREKKWSHLRMLKRPSILMFTFLTILANYSFASMWLVLPSLYVLQRFHAWHNERPERKAIRVRDYIDYVAEQEPEELTWPAKAYLAVLALRYKIKEYFSSLPYHMWAPLTIPTVVRNVDDFSIAQEAGTRMEYAVFHVGAGQDYPSIVASACTLRDDINIVVFVSNDRDAEYLYQYFKKAGLKKVDERVRFIQGFPSMWARDPYVVLVDPHVRQFTVVPSQKYASCDEDLRVPYDIMKHAFTKMSSQVLFSKTGEVPYMTTKTVVHSDERDLRDIKLPKMGYPYVDFQGGDTTSDDAYVYSGETTLEVSQYNRNNERVCTREEALRNIEHVAKKRMIVLPNKNIDPHNDRYHMPLGKTLLGERTNLLIDPVWALEIIRDMSGEEKEAAYNAIRTKRLSALDAQPYSKNGMRQDMEEEMEAFHTFLFSVNDQMITEVKASPLVKELEDVKRMLEEKHQITVVRIPGLLEGCAESPMALCSTNSYFDSAYNKKTEAIETTAFIPQYNIPSLDKTIRSVYEQCGFALKTIDSSVLAFYNAGPRCMIQTIGYPVHARPTREVRDSRTFHTLYEWFGGMMLFSMIDIRWAFVVGGVGIGYWLWHRWGREIWWPYQIYVGDEEYRVRFVDGITRSQDGAIARSIVPSEREYMCTIIRKMILQDRKDRGREKRRSRFVSVSALTHTLLSRVYLMKWGKQVFVIKLAEVGKGDFLKNQEQAIRVLNPKRERQDIPYVVLSGNLDTTAYEEVFGREYFLVVNCLDGYNLQKAYEKQGMFNERDIATFGLSMARLLTYIHSRGIILRELKADDVWVLPDGNAGLFDFNVSMPVTYDWEKDRLDLKETVFHELVEDGYGDGRMIKYSSRAFRIKPDEQYDIYAFGMLLTIMISISKRMIDEPEIMYMNQIKDKRLREILKKAKAPRHKRYKRMAEVVRDLTYYERYSWISFMKKIWSVIDVKNDSVAVKPQYRKTTMPGSDVFDSSRDLQKHSSDRSAVPILKEDSLSEEYHSIQKKLWNKISASKTISFEKALIEVQEYLSHREHVLAKELSLVVTKEIMEHHMWSQIKKQVDLLKMRIETYDPEKAYDAERHIVLAVETEEMRQATQIRTQFTQQKKEIVVMGIDINKGAFFIEFYPKFIALIKWFESPTQVCEDVLFASGFEGVLRKGFIVIDGTMADSLLSQTHKQFLQEQFSVAA